MPDNNKLVIRRLPPSMSEDDFLKQISPIPSHDYFCFVEANPNLGQHAYSRAYINFKNTDDMSTFREQFDNYIFLDKNGSEYQAVVEQSFWHKYPKCGPFYRPISPDTTTSSLGNGHSSQTKSNTATRIEQDPDFLEFMDNLRAQRNGPQQSTIQKIETHLDELTKSTATSTGGGKDNSKTLTPLLGYVNQKRNKKNTKRAR